MIKETQEFLNYFLSESLVVDGIAGNKTKSAIEEAIRRLQLMFKKRGWKWQDDFNFIGLRVDYDFDDTFEDWFVIFSSGTIVAVPASTTSGVPGIAKYVNRWINGVAGVGTICENQQIDYLLVKPVATNSWSLWTGGLGFGYQDKPISVYRGAIKNPEGWVINTKVRLDNVFGGFNNHSWAGYSFFQVSNLSEGCQVTKAKYWNELIFPMICKHAKNGRYTYSLMQDNI
jgi:hypothetical protein